MEIMERVMSASWKKKKLQNLLAPKVTPIQQQYTDQSLCEKSRNHLRGSGTPCKHETSYIKLSMIICDTHSP